MRVDERGIWLDRAVPPRRVSEKELAAAIERAVAAQTTPRPFYVGGRAC